MLSDPIRNRVVDPDEMLFWKQLKEAVDQIATNNEQSVSFEQGERRADIEASGSAIIIFITEVEKTPQTLIVPPGSMELTAKDKELVDDNA